MLLDPRYRHIGVGTANHRQYENIAIILLAEDVSELRASQYEPEPEVRDVRDVQDMGHSVGNDYFINVSQPHINEN